MKKYLLPCFIFSCAVFKTTSAQITPAQLLGQTNPIPTAVPFLLISPDARGGALADCGAATSPDVFNLHYNPSKLAFVTDKIGAGISYSPWLRARASGINFAYLNLYYKPRFNGVFSSSFRYISYRVELLQGVVGQNLAQFRPNEWAGDLSYARLLSKKFSMAMSVRYIYSNLTSGFSVTTANSIPGQSVAADVSANYRTATTMFNKPLNLSSGINISNMGSRIAYTNTGIKEFIPANLRIGQAANFSIDDYNNIGLLLDFNKLLVPTDTGTTQPISSPVWVSWISSFSDAPDGFHEELSEITIGGGIEYWYGKPRSFALRAGYFHEHATKGNRKYLTFGFGFKYNAFGFDFAWLVPTDKKSPLEGTIRFSLLFNFTQFIKQKAPEVFISG